MISRRSDRPTDWKTESDGSLVRVQEIFIEQWRRNFGAFVIFDPAPPTTSAAIILMTMMEFHPTLNFMTSAVSSFNGCTRCSCCSRVQRQKTADGLVMEMWPYISQTVKQIRLLSLMNSWYYFINATALG